MPFLSRPERHSHVTTGRFLQRPETQINLAATDVLTMSPEAVDETFR